MERWDKKSLAEICKVNYGKSPKEIISSDGSFPVVGTGGEARLAGSYLYNGESIVLGRKGTIDKPSYVKGKFWVIDTAFYLSNFEKNISVKFLYYLLLQKNLRSLNESTGVPSISRDALYKLEFQIPSLESEQKRIVEIIDSADEAIAHTEALIAKYQRIKTGLMQDLLTRGIDEHGNIRSEATHRFKDSLLGRIPVEWDVSNLESLTRSIITYGIVQAGPDIPNGIPYIRTGDMAGDFLAYQGLQKTSKHISSKYSRSQVDENDLVFALRATIGKVLTVPKELEGANLTQGTARIAPNWEIISTNYLLWTIRMFYFKSQILKLQKGTTFSEITLGELRKMEVKYPNKLEEQERITNTIGKQESLIQYYKQNLFKLLSLKTGLMQDLLSGKVRVQEEIK